MGAAAVMVITAGGAFKWAASPFKTQVWELEDTAASFSGGTGVIFITYRWRFHRTWRSWAWIWWVWSGFSGVGRLHRNPTETGWGSDIALHLDVATFTPAPTPRVSHNPVINASFRTISNHIYTMIQICSTPSSEYTLNAYTYNKLEPFLVEVRKNKNFIEIEVIPIGIAGNFYHLLQWQQTQPVLILLFAVLSRCLQGRLRNYQLQRPWHFSRGGKTQ